MGPVYFLVELHVLVMDVIVQLKVGTFYVVFPAFL